MSMFICKDCSEVFGEENIGYSNSYLCTIDGVSYSERVIGDCPNCGGELVPAKQCKICEDWKDEETDICNYSLRGNVCYQCLDKKSTRKMAITIGKEFREKVEINGFLANIFTTNEIEAILSKELLQRGDASAKAKEYCSTDLNCLSEFVMDEWEQST